MDNMTPAKTFEMRTCISTLSLLHNKPKAAVHKLTGPKKKKKKKKNSFPDKAKVECQSKFGNLTAVYLWRHTIYIYIYYICILYTYNICIHYIHILYMYTIYI